VTPRRPFKRVLVTGVAGFIGSNLSRMLLEQGFEVVGVDNLSAGTLENVPKGVELHKADIRYPLALAPAFRGVDAVFHLAAKNCLIDCLQNPEETMSTNVVGTVNVLETCRQQGIERVIYADTSAEYEGVETFPSREDVVCPIGTYAVAKRSGALLCDSYARLHGLKVTTLRYFNVYGPAQDFRRVVPPVMSGFAMKMLAGEQPIIYGTGEKRRDFIYVDDVNRFHLLCLTDDRTIGGTFNVGSGINYSVNDIYERLAVLLGVAAEPLRKPDLPGEAEITLADTSAAAALGWKPLVGIDEGLRHTVDYLRARLGLAGEPVGARA
jgi:UDP-glucose 4-epimerase